MPINAISFRYCNVTAPIQFSTMWRSSNILQDSNQQINKLNNDARRNNFIEFSDFDNWIRHMQLDVENMLLLLTYIHMMKYRNR